MKISIVINSFNQGEFIEKAIKSALMQSYPRKDYEIIVVDACSTDNTGKILSKYISEIKVVKQTEKLGLTVGCNLGIRSSSTEYVVRLDADDLFCQDILLVEASWLDKSPEVDFVYPDYFAKTNNIEKRIHLPDFSPNEIYERGDFLGGGTMYRRALLERHGYYDESFKTIENYELILRMVKSGAIGLHIELPLFIYNIRENSMSTDRNLLPEAVKMLEMKYGIEYRTNKYHPRNITFGE